MVAAHRAPMVPFRGAERWRGRLRREAERLFEQLRNWLGDRLLDPGQRSRHGFLDGPGRLASDHAFNGALGDALDVVDHRVDGALETPRRPGRLVQDGP